jgi:hypothetical protein
MEEMNFEEMRNQFAILKEQLNKQEIVNDRLLRESMKTKSQQNINQSKTRVWVAAFLCVILFPLSYLNNVWSLPFALVSGLIVIFCVVCTSLIHRHVDKLDFMKDDFITVARVMAKFKRQYDNWLHYAFPVIILPWVIWACYENAWRRNPGGANPWMMCIPIIVGVAIGAIIGYHFHRKAVNAAQDILDEIEEKGGVSNENN